MYLVFNSLRQCELSMNVMMRYNNSLLVFSLMFVIMDYFANCNPFHSSIY